MKASPGRATNAPGVATFAAIRLDDTVRLAAVRAMDALAASGAAVRVERPEKLHVTLAYLGRVDAAKSAEFAAAMRAAAARCEPFEIVFDVLGGFPNERRPRVLWLGSSLEPAGFSKCAALIRAGFEEAGARFDNPAVAHITLARAKTPLHGMPQIEAPPPCVLAVREVVLFESIPAGPTTRYEERAVARLRS